MAHFQTVVFLLFQNHVTASDVGSKSSTGCQPPSDQASSSYGHLSSPFWHHLWMLHTVAAGLHCLCSFQQFEKSHGFISFSQKKTVDSLRGDGDAVNHSDSNHEVNTKSASICVMTLYVERPLLQSVAWTDTKRSTLAMNTMCVMCAVKPSPGLPVWSNTKGSIQVINLLFAMCVGKPFE